jgi:uncharacterized protein (TIGR02145 family)
MMVILIAMLGITSCDNSSEPPPDGGTVNACTIPTVEYESKIYHTVGIGSQCWLKENMDVGTMIGVVITASDNGTVEKYCYDNDTANCARYGGLYTWGEAMQYTTTRGARGICPPGWHIPTAPEWDTLRAAVHNDGNALKEVGQGAGTNTSGFSALLAGERYYNGYSFNDTGKNAKFWKSTERGNINAYYLNIYGGNSDGIDAGTYVNKNYGESVRCLKDYGVSPNPPSSPSPADGDTAVFSSVVLGWSCSDPDGDPLLYDLYFGTANPPAVVDSFLLEGGRQRRTRQRPCVGSGVELHHGRAVRAVLSGNPHDRLRGEDVQHGPGGGPVLAEGEP